MSEIESTLSSTQQENAKAECAALRWQINRLLIALLMVSVTLTFYLWLQSRRSSFDLAIVRQQSAPAIQNYQQNEKALADFINKLVEFGRTHPDFQQILNKYPLAPLTSLNAPKATATPPPAAPPSMPAAAPKK